MNDPFSRYVPLGELEEQVWELERGIAAPSPEAKAAALRRLTPLLVLGGLLFLLLLGRLFLLQVVRVEEFRLAAEGNRIRTTEIPAPRGLILDRDGNPIVKNVPSFSLEIIPAYLPSGHDQLEKVLAKIREVTGLTVEVQAVKTAGRTIEPLSLKDDLTYEQALIWELQLADQPGVVIAKRPRREYRDLPGIAHLLGYIGRIAKEELNRTQTAGDSRYSITSFVGKEGLELFYEEYLKGTDGRTQVEVDAVGRKIRQLASIAPQAGFNLRLFLHPKVQEVLSNALVNAVKRVGRQAGAAIAIDPKSGGVLGLASFPSFEPEMFSGSASSEEIQRLLADPNHPLVNRPIAGLYPPGSTIKPLWAAAALQEGTISTKTTVPSVGGFTVGGFSFKDWKSGGHGLTDIRKAIAESVNTFFYAVTGGYGDVPGLGIDRLKSYATKFGIGNKTGIDLPGEGKGFFPDPEWKRRTRNEGWFIGNTYQLGIGQGDVLVTPIELLMALTSIVNDGELLRPRVVAEIVSPDGRLIKSFNREVIRSGFIDPQNLQVVRESMRQTVTEGSARLLNDLTVEVGGKTGTAQFAANKNTHAWFFGFAPWQDPEIAVLVLVEGGGEGTTVAAPVAKEVFRAYFGQ